MHIYRRCQLREKVPLSDEHIRRLEAVGQFPKRFKLVDGSGRNGAVGWDGEEVDQWIEERRNSREAASSPAKA